MEKIWAPAPSSGVRGAASVSAAISVVTCEAERSGSLSREEGLAEGEVCCCWVLRNAPFILAWSVSLLLGNPSCPSPPRSVKLGSAQTSKGICTHAHVGTALPDLGTQQQGCFPTTTCPSLWGPFQ